MAALTASKDHTILSFSDISIILCFDGNHYSEQLLKHESSLSKEESDNNEVNMPIICSSVSHNGVYFSCSIHKDLFLWDTKDWHLVSKRQAHRSASALVFSPKDDNIAVADKSGDVFLFSVINPEKPGELILGHISMLLDILITPNGKYIITSDRDEKIRVSCFPNAYNIKSYCLGHEEFVTCLNILPHNESILVSGSGDGTLRFWNYESGIQLLCYICNESDPDLGEGTKPVISKVRSLKYNDIGSVLCVQLVTLKGILVYSINCDINGLKCVFKQRISVDSEPWCLWFSGTCLWILKQNIEECLSAYNFYYDKNEFILNDNFTSVIQILKKHSNLFEIVFKKGRQLDSLYKRRFDNVQEYLKRKMSRIETDGKKSKSGLPIS